MDDKISSMGRDELEAAARGAAANEAEVQELRDKLAKVSTELIAVKRELDETKSNRGHALRMWAIWEGRAEGLLAAIKALKF